MQTAEVLNSLSTDTYCYSLALEFWYAVRNSFKKDRCQKYYWQECEKGEKKGIILLNTCWKRADAIKIFCL